MSRDIVLQVWKAVPNYRNRGRSRRYDRVYSSKGLWGKMKMSAANNKPVEKGDFSINLLRDVYSDLFWKDRIKETPETRAASKKLMKWVNQKVKRTIGDR